MKDILVLDREDGEFWGVYRLPKEVELPDYTGVIVVGEVAYANTSLGKEDVDEWLEENGESISQLVRFEGVTEWEEILKELGITKLSVDYEDIDEEDYLVDYR